MHLVIGALALHVPFAPYNAFCTQVQLMRGEFLETALYWAGVVSVRLDAIAEKKVTQHSCVWSSVWI